MVSNLNEMISTSTCTIVIEVNAWVPKPQSVDEKLDPQYGEAWH
jgi:hypothetical protein